MTTRRRIIATLTLTAICGLLTLAPQKTVGQAKVESPAVKYWILFKDKDAGLGKGPAPIEPGFVTDRAAARRELRGRPVQPTLDAPISASYVATLRSMGVEPIVESRWLNGVSAYLSADLRDRVEQLSFVRRLKAVAVAVDEAMPAPVVLAESHSPLELDFGSSISQLQTINAVSTIQEGYTGSGILLGYLDTKTDTSHPALKHLEIDNRVVAIRDFTTEGGLAPQTNKHGLATASVALGFDEGNLIGACYGAEYMLATTEYGPTETNQEEDFFVAGMEWMERMGADIVNVSLGYSEFDDGQHSYSYRDMNGHTAITTRAADRAASLGVVVVVSAGNEGCSNPNSCWYYITSPADGDSVITAGASDFNFNPVLFSGAGPTYDGRIKPDVSAPGVGVRFASSNGLYSTGGGTSFSSPLIASVACQLLEANPGLNPIQVRTILRSTAHLANNPDNKLGWGVINAVAALSVAKSTVATTDEIPPDNPVTISVYPNPANDQSVVSIGPSLDQAEIQVAVYDVLGREVARVQPSPAGEASTASLHVKELPSGMYFVRISGNVINATRTLIVTH